MKCPYCDEAEDRVLDSRPGGDNSVIRRRRECLSCHKRFTTFERVEPLPLMVVKSNNRREPFDLNKLKVGILKACEKRPISIDTIEKIVTEISDELQDYVMEVPSKTIGEMTLERLKPLDAVAYIRFASVYQNFMDLDAFLKELERLKTELNSNGKNTKRG